MGPTGWQAGNDLNPLQVAQLRWYDANKAGNKFAVGSFPTGICFDGANIWVTNAGSDTVTKLRASDGALLGTFAVGGVPRGHRLRRREHLGRELRQQHRDEAAGERRRTAGNLCRRLDSPMASPSTARTSGSRTTAATP